MQVPIKRAHFIGIGGAGMSGIAKVLFERGCEVSGSDLKRSYYVRELDAMGIPMYVGHAAQTIDQIMPDVVVISTAIPETNPELLRARELGLEVWQRAKMLSYLSRGSKTIAVAGTHGKTTTSSMIATLFDELKLDPSFLIGGIVEGYNTNGKNGRGDYFVCEADESDGSFMYLHPHVVVVTNIEADHLDHYKDLAHIEDTFVNFMSLVDTEGALVVNADDPHYLDLARKTNKKIISYGLDPTADFVIVPHPEQDDLSEPFHPEHFEVQAPNQQHVSLALSHNPGIHNMKNAAAALAVAWVLGIKLADAAEALSRFKGAHRRFTHVGTVSNITIVDDYGHHPTEIKATLAAAHKLGFKRVVCLFQPHRYSRTQALADEFAHAFKDCDVLRVMDVFAAGEMPIPGISGKTLAEAVKATDEVADVDFVAERQKLIQHLAELLQPGDLILTMGAGDVSSTGPLLLETLSAKLAQQSAHAACTPPDASIIAPTSTQLTGRE